MSRPNDASGRGIYTRGALNPWKVPGRMVVADTFPRWLGACWDCFVATVRFKVFG